MALLPGGVLSYFSDEQMRTSLGVTKLPLGSDSPVALPLTEAPYNYEHAFTLRLPGGGDDAWWLCPDNASDSAAWVSALNLETSHATDPPRASARRGSSGFF